MTRRPNILFITSDQQRGDCYGFEGRAVKTPHLDEHGARRHALLGLHHAQPRLPAVARVDPDRPAAAHARRRTTTASTCRTTSRRGGLRRHASRARATTPAFIGKAHFTTVAHLRADRHAGVPREPGAATAPTGSARTWASQHVELMLEGHNHCPADAAAARPALRALVPRGRSRRRADRAVLRRSCRRSPTRRRPGTPALPVAWHNSTWIGDRTIEFLRAHRDAAVLRLGVVPRSAPSVRRAGAVVPAARSRRGRPAGAPHARPRAAAVVAQGEPRRHAGDGQRRAAQVPREVSRARRCRPTRSCAR